MDEWIKKKEMLPFVPSWMGLEDITLSETSQTEKDKYHIILLVCGPKNTKQNKL